MKLFSQTIEEKRIEDRIYLLYAWTEDVDALCDGLEEKIENFFDASPKDMYCGLAGYSESNEKEGACNRYSHHKSMNGIDESYRMLALVCKTDTCAKDMEEEMERRHPGITHRYTDVKDVPYACGSNENSKVVYLIRRGAAYRGPKPKER